MRASGSSGWAARASSHTQLARWLAVLAMLLVVPGVLGWLLGVRALIQPLATFAPARLGGALLIALAAGALLAKLAARRRTAQVLVVLCALLSLSGIVLALQGGVLPFEQWLQQRVDHPLPVTTALPVSVGLLYLMYAAALSLLLRARTSDATLFAVAGLASSQVALAGVLFLAQLTGLLDDTRVQPLRAPLHALLAALALGVALLDRLSRREAQRLAPPRWVPMLAGVSAALVVLVLWQALNARERAQARTRSELSAAAIDRAVQRQFGIVERALARGAAYLQESAALDDPLWRVGFSRLVSETEGLRHLLWFDRSGALLRSASTDTLPAVVTTALAARVRQLIPEAGLALADTVAPNRSTLIEGPWPLAAWAPVLSTRLGATILVGLVDEVALIRPFLLDVAPEVRVRVRAGDTTVLQLGDEAFGPPSVTTPLSIGARRLSLEVAERRDLRRSPLPEVVLVLGLAVSLLLALTLWQQRRIWWQAHEESQRFRAVFDTAFQVQLLLDTDGTMLEANRAAGELAGEPAEQLLGLPFWRAPWWSAETDIGERVQERFARACAGETQRFEVELTQGRDRAVTMDFSLKPLLDTSPRVQRVHRVIAEGRDLTVRKRAEESMREVSALTTMGQLAARVAHEINNPLAGIQNAFLLVRGAIPEDHPHYGFVGAIEREIARIAAVTRQLYETYRPDHLLSTQSSVILAVSDAVTFLEQVNRGRAVRIVTDMSRAPSLVPIPDALLRQTLYNLVQNAVDVSPPGGVVTVQAVQDGTECVLRVSDDGPGVPVAMRDRIFDPFFSTKDRTMKTGGMGIGLALVRQSVLAVGGRIAVHDRPGGGTEFEVRLPMIPLETGALR